MEGVADAQRRLGKVFDTQDFTVVLHDGPLAGQEVPHVHVHVMPRTQGDGGAPAKVEEDCVGAAVTAVLQKHLEDLGEEL